MGQNPTKWGVKKDQNSMKMGSKFISYKNGVTKIKLVSKREVKRSSQPNKGRSKDRTNLIKGGQKIEPT